MDRFIGQSPFFGDEHRRLAASVASFVWREIEPYAAQAEGASDEDFRALVALLAEADLLRFAVRSRPDARLDVRSLCLVREELAYSSALADAAFVMQGLGTYAVSLAAPEHVREFWVARAAAGRAVAAFALTEPEAGSDVSSITTTARLDGDAYVLDGRKHLISNAGVADFYTVFARTGTRADGRAEMSAFVVSPKMPGFSLRERTRLLGAHPIGEIEFKNLRVPAEDRVGGEGDGHRLAMRTMNVFRPSVGAAACGMARRALDEAVAHAKRRRQFGAPLSSYQLTQAKLAEMATELDAARLLVYHAAHLRDAQLSEGDETLHQSDLTRAASEAKLYATEAAQRVIDDALQIHGGAGLVRGSVVERLYRDVRALRIYEGTSEIQKLIIARELLKE
ncbi:MAG: acyl-CoA dehydrogenase family protein [Acidobacteria bacterium]|nr:acyl-CoA dehydrogenase family protein [Acidobacteriota bacterium]MCA1641533.1 acyl-CoA dehydrogenase family protein [Acidobacteriota bacterium]